MQLIQKQAKEYVDGMVNPSVIIEKYMETFDMTQNGYVPFKLFPMQKRLVYALQEYRFNLVTKPRQTGVSTTTAAFMAVKLAYADEDTPETIVIVANKLAQAKEFLSKIREFLHYIPRWMWGDYFDDNKRTEGYVEGKGSTEHLKLLNGSHVIAKATSKDALRGYTPTYVVIDEAAFIETAAEELYAASMAAISTGGKMILISTPNGQDPLYYTTYMNALKGANDFNIVELKWYQDGRYNKGLYWLKPNSNGFSKIPEEKFTLESYKEKIKLGWLPRSPWYIQACRNLNNNKIKISREIEVSFEGSANTFINAETIKLHEIENVTEPLIIKSDGILDSVWIWEEPKEGVEYVMGIDVASGKSDDFSTIVIINVRTLEQVAEYVKKVTPNILGEVAYELGNMYSALTIIDDTGGYGSHTIQELIDKEYKYLYYIERERDKLEKGLPASAGIKIGRNRQHILSTFASYVEENDLKIKSKRLLHEIQTFIMVNGRPDHQQNSHDDIIFACALAIWAYETGYKQMEKSKAVSDKALDILKYSMIDAKKEQPVKNRITDTKNHLIQKRKKSFGKQNDTGDYSWLLG